MFLFILAILCMLLGAAGEFIGLGGGWLIWVGIFWLVLEGALHLQAMREIMEQWRKNW